LKRSIFFDDDDEDFLLDAEVDGSLQRVDVQLPADVGVEEGQRCLITSAWSALRVVLSGRDIRRNLASQIHTPTLTCTQTTNL